MITQKLCTNVSLLSHYNIFNQPRIICISLLQPPHHPWGSSCHQKLVKIKKLLNTIEKKALSAQKDEGKSPPKVVLCVLSKVSVYSLYFTYIITDCPRINMQMIIISPRSLTYFPSSLQGSPGGLSGGLWWSQTPVLQLANSPFGEWGNSPNRGELELGNFQFFLHKWTLCSFLVQGFFWGISTVLAQE